MGKATTARANQSAEMGPKQLSSSQTAEYTQDMLDSLRKIAERQRHDMLARLLEAAAIEAGRLAGRTSPG